MTSLLQYLQDKKNIFKKTYWTLIYFFCLQSIDCLGNQDPIEQQKINWVIKGSIAERNRAYQMEETVRLSTPPPMVRKKYKKINPDGTVWTRQEIESPHVKRIIINNDDGVFEIIGDNVIKDETPNALPPETVAAKPQRHFELIDADTILVNKKNRISRKEKPELFADIERLVKEEEKGEVAPQFPEMVYLNRTCYIIDQTNPDSGEKKRTIIDKKDHFILQRQVYDRNGKLTYETKVTSLILDPNLPDELFATPQKKVITVAKNNQDLSAKQKEALENTFVTTKKSTMQNKGKNHFFSVDAFLKYGTYFFASIGLLCILVIAYTRIPKTK